MSPAAECPLCAGPDAGRHAEVAGVLFHGCARCGLVFRDPGRWPTAEAEQALYRTHRNDPADAGYRRFVQPLADALLARLSTGSRGLDFGCGDGSALAAMLTESGVRVRGYDPLFLPDPAALDDTYDFIALCEVAEHLHRPTATFALLDRLLRPGGLLALKTGFLPAPERFSRWHYLRDPTHVLFFSPPSLRWLGDSMGYACAFPCADVAILHKPAAPS